MGEVIELNQSDVLAQCPECGEYQWHMIVDAVEIKNIQGIICANPDCQLRVEWEAAK